MEHSKGGSNMFPLQIKVNDNVHEEIKSASKLKGMSIQSFFNIVISRECRKIIKHEEKKNEQQ